MAMERNSLLVSIVFNFLTIGGFLIIAILLLIGISEYRQTLQESGSPRTRLYASFFLSIFIVYFLTFICLTVIQCRDAWNSIFIGHPIVPSDVPSGPENLPADRQRQLHARVP